MRITRPRRRLLAWPLAALALAAGFATSRPSAQGDTAAIIARIEAPQLPAAHLDRGEALAATVINDQFGNIVLVEALYGWILERSLEQRMQNVKS